MKFPLEVDFCPGMGNGKHVEKRCLLHLLTGIQIGFYAGKNLFAHGGKILGIIQAWIQNKLGIFYLLSFLRCIVMEIRSDSQGKHLRYPIQPAAQCYIFCRLFTHGNSLPPSFPADRRPVIVRNYLQSCGLHDFHQTLLNPLNKLFFFPPFTRILDSLTPWTLCFLTQ